MLNPPTVVSEKILHRGFNTLKEFEISTNDGAIHRREIVDHGHAAAVLLLNQERGVLTLVRQFRLAAQLNGDDGFVLEACAGLLDGDDAEACAKREALEETGIAPNRLLKAFDFYGSPGSLTEKTGCFIGFYTEADRQHRGGGLAHEGEEIEPIEIGFAEALPMIRAGAIIDGKTIALIQHAALEGLLKA